MRLHVSYCSITGPVRKRNEDDLYIPGVDADRDSDVIGQSILEDRDRTAIAVFDGMGGEAYGAEASRIARDVFSVTERDYETGGILPSESAAGFTVRANSEIIGMAGERGGETSGSTFAAVYIDGTTVHAFNFGDSRIYRKTGNGLELVSRDHTLAERKIRAGIYTREEAASYNETNILTSFLGMGDHNLKPYAAGPFSLCDGAVLICSDGLSGCLDEERISSIMDSADPASLFVRETLAAGLNDNLTTVVIKAV